MDLSKVKLNDAFERDFQRRKTIPRDVSVYSLSPIVRSLSSVE
jgi:hypothetical protein